MQPEKNQEVLELTREEALHMEHNSMTHRDEKGLVFVDSSSLLAVSGVLPPKNSYHVITVPIADMLHYTPWVNGEVIFENMPLQDMMSYLSRGYDTDYLFKEGSIGEWRFTGGILKYLPMEESFEAVEQTADIQFRNVGTTVETSRKRRQNQAWKMRQHPPCESSKPKSSVNEHFG